MTTPDWGDKSEPWIEIEEFSQIIIDKINIIDILDKYGIEYTKACSGNFNYKLRCPLPVHLDGNERTPSMYVSDKNNDFHCYGCNSGGTVISFMMMYHGEPYLKSMERLATYAGITEGNIDLSAIKPREKVNPEHTIAIHVYRSGLAIREYLKKLSNSDEYKDNVVWAGRQFDRLDRYLIDFDDEKWEEVKKYHDKVIRFIEAKVNK